MIKVGITGGVGCGKSTAARILETHDFERLDSDQIVRDSVLQSAAVVAAIREKFGPEFIRRDGVVDRPTLAERVFSSDSDRLWLEGLVHPHVFRAWRDAFAGGLRQRWVVEVPLLFEGRLENWFDFTVCVALAPRQQLARLEQRGLSPELASRRISKQLPLSKEVELADFVLWNDGSPKFLEAQVDSLVRVLAGR